MSWPSAYGYKYTPIGLRQRELKDESGSKTFSTTVHLPMGGHLLDIERRYNSDGTISKKETNSYVPESSSAPRPHYPTYSANPNKADFEPRLSDIERQADDIIANFRARHGTGMEDSTRGQVTASSKAKICSSLAKEELCQCASSRSANYFFTWGYVGSPEEIPVQTIPTAA